MDFASSHINMAYDSEEDDLELSDTEMDQGMVGGLDFAELEAAAPADDADDLDLFGGPPAAAPVAAAAAPAPGRGGGSIFSSLRDRLQRREERAAPPARRAAPARGGAPAPAPVPPPAESIISNRLRRQQRQKAKKSRKPERKRRRQRVNTNVVSLKLGTLAVDADDLQTGDPTFCANKGCKCVFNSTSKTIDLAKLREENKEDPQAAKYEDVEIDDDQTLWVCEFCGEKNVVDIEEEEVPKGESQDYILEPAPEQAKEKAKDDSQMVIFCVDVSGSMCVTKEVHGKFKLKGDRHEEFAGLNVDGEDQFFPGQNRQSTWISRLQAVQAAVNSQIEKLAEVSPNFRVGLVTFSNEVTIYGDGTSPVEVVTGDKLRNQEALQSAGEKYLFEKSVKDSKDALTKKLFELEEGGPTALGPALTVSIAMASKSKGSKVVICTDGLANVGLGSLDIDLNDDDMATEVENWYEGMGNYGAMNGVMVSVISITDDQCRLENLGKVCDLTNGHVDQIDPLELMNNFGGILENPVISTNVNATMYVHCGLRLRRDEDNADKEEEEEAKDRMEDENLIVDRISRDIGNVTEDSQIFFEYSVRKEELKKHKDLDALPFQVQIKYTKLDGSRCIRVITQLKPITLDQRVAEKDVNIGVMSARAAQQSAIFAEKGDYEASRAVNFGNALFLDRVCERPEQQLELQGHLKESAAWDSVLHREQQTEVRENRNLKVSGKKLKKKGRSRARKDEVSSAMYRMKHKSYNSK